ncbi:NAD(P)/FAD-dependent oxidoreductase [Nocardioides zeae]|uniref:NAD(P)/FAD-dependent oxidoreductase n=1 Tax=Nocardioides imazamoxiresistens TaxID=3231893 RepID=A0ABU3PVV9_9ACTN|nr:NAD(P)/FAD-dependent oxidoreductase [Nocardioides zeae]MDT9593329.1 NAD(P)/FAD-dependent oxidoreductase [Nocardioides zeae]
MAQTSARPQDPAQGRTPEHVDVLVVGAGLSGIGAAARLVRDHPDLSVLILESRERLGGTWDLFRYPGVRSDSDMFTLGYRFKPWLGEKSLADGAAIREYVHETAEEHGLLERIRYSHEVVAASWSSEEARWTVDVLADGEPTTFTTGFLYCCSGYYDYESGYRPTFPGEEHYRGELVHPQQWPEDLEYASKQVVVIGSGATAITLVPSMAGTAAHVTMLQRTPTYVISIPAVDPLARVLRRVLPEMTAYQVTRWRNVLQQMAFYNVSQALPGVVRRGVKAWTRRQLPGVDVDTHFHPPYDPWDQRFCVVPDGDLYKALRSGDASIATGTIETFTERGVRLTDGTELEADVVVTATGLNLKAFGGIALEVDGVDVKLPDTMAYRALMLTGVPNFAYTIGYTNASWTLKADLVADFVSAVVAKLQRDGLRKVEVERDPSVGEEPFMDFEAGYVLRSVDQLPKQGSRTPWRMKQNYVYDLRAIRGADLDADPALVWS